MMIRIFIFLWMIFVWTTGFADTHVAASCNQVDVSAAVSLASDGDTVTVPAGTCAWSSTLSFSKGISLIGAGKTATIITNNVGTLIRVTNTQNNFVRISGFRFNNGSGAVSVVSLVGPIYKARIDNCIFNVGDSAIGTNYPTRGTGPVYGVADNNEFYNFTRTYFAADLRIGDSLNGSVAWAEFLGNEASFPGSNKMWYFEDNVYTWSGGSPEGALYGQYGGKAVLRYNTLNGTCVYGDAHGDTPDYGTIYYEIYNNTFNVSTTYCSNWRVIWMRGGQLIAHDNTFNSVPTSTTPFGMSVYWETDLPEHRIKNTYYWGNVKNGTITNQAELVVVRDSGQTSSGYSAANIRLDQEYFLHEPQVGQVYYPYTPYTYPHPLRSATFQISPPTSLRILQ